MYFSFIIPVYNRPDEVDELLQSLTQQNFNKDFEVVIIEDGSTLKCDEIIENYKDKLTISYYFKENSGPGDSRNYGMKVAKGNYFLILDSDCLLPEDYLINAEKNLENDFVHCFGGTDKALDSFSEIQKAINFSMTSFLTTGGIRGGSEAIEKFQPRSFNMGLSKEAFEKSNGFGNIHPGEDPDLSIRLWNLGYKTKLFKDVYVFHKRRIDWNKFFIQVNKFGKARPILNSWHPQTAKITYWFPTLFSIGLLLSVPLFYNGIPFLYWLYAFYFAILFVFSVIQNKSIKIGFFSIIAVFIQFFGYGFGFLESFFKISVLKKNPEEVFPELFFKK